MTRYFLDSNILINALNNKTSASGVLLTFLLQDKISQIFVSPLVLYEVLRGVNWENEVEFAEAKLLLSHISNINIDKQIAELASNLFRLEKKIRSTLNENSKKIDKHNFDIMHFSTAKVNGFTIIVFRYRYE